MDLRLPEQPSGMRQDAWTVFARRDASPQFIAAVLELTLHRMNVPPSAHGWVFTVPTSSPDGAPTQLQLVAAHPRGVANVDDHLTELLARIAATPEGVVEPAEQSLTLAMPVLDSGKLRAILVVRLPDQEQMLQVRDLMRELHWSSSWILEWLTRQPGHELQPPVAAHQGDEDVTAPVAADVLDLLTETFRAERFDEAATVMTNALADTLNIEQVSLGLKVNNRVRLLAASRSARVNNSPKRRRHLEAAMAEAIDQKQRVSFPAVTTDTSGVIVRAHSELLETGGGNAAVSIPFDGGHGIDGAITLEAPTEISAAGREFVSQIVVLGSGALVEKWRNDRPLPLKATDALRNQLAKLLGPKHPIRKAIAILLAIGIAVSALVDTAYVVTGKAQIEPNTKRIIAAPFDGYVADSVSRAGDEVDRGGVLVRFEKTDLLVEKAGLEAARNQKQVQAQEARASLKLAEANALEAEVAAIEAQLKLVDTKLTRAEITSPFRGLVISGDLSQSIGDPVRQGQELFQIAPADDFKVVVDVDERDIADIEVGQTGRLLLATYPDTPFEIEITRVTPVLNTTDGRNVYRIESAIQGNLERDLRPGLEGRARIDVGDRNVFWIWTHDVVTWARLTAWSVFP